MVVVLILGTIAVWVAAGTPSRPAGSPAASSTTTSSSQPPTSSTNPPGTPSSGVGLTTALLPTKLPAAISREAAVAVGRDQALVLGGLTGTGTTASSVYVMNLTTGTALPVGSLAFPTHDAGATALAQRALVFGGGQSTSMSTVQAIPLSAASARGAGASPAVSQVVGKLPGLRSDDEAVTIGHTAYVIGGYDGGAPDPEVLATSNGRTFSPVVALPVPVRYAAVAALGNRIYVFGGEAVTGPQAGQAVDDIQVVDPARRTASIVGHLSQAVEAAAAFDLGGRLYVAGGDTAPGIPLPSTVTGTPTQKTATGAVTIPTVWRFDPQSASTTVVGQLPVAVSNAGVAVSGSSAWLIGGETDGIVVADIQRATLGTG